VEMLVVVVVVCDAEDSGLLVLRESVPDLFPSSGGLV
jgi:hypothetical protein